MLSVEEKNSLCIWLYTERELAAAHKEMRKSFSEQFTVWGNKRKVYKLLTYNCD